MASIKSAIDALKVFQVLLVFGLWPLTGATLASSIGLGATMNQVHLADWLWLTVLAGVSGIISLLHRVRSLLEEAAAALGDAPPTSTDPSRNARLAGWKMFAACHMTGALFVGAVVFFLLESIPTNPMIEAPAIAVCSWAGAKVADTWASAFGDRIMDVLSVFKR